MPSDRPNVLLLDIETSPLITYTWGLFDQNIALNQIKQEWFILSWSAKWYENEKGDILGPHNKMMYMDQRSNKKIVDDKKLLQAMWTLLDKADIVVTQNGRSFDIKKLNAKFILNEFKPYSSIKHIDTLRIARKHFAFTSNKLEYTSNKLCKKYKKLKHKKFPGFEMWQQCLNGNKSAWMEMERYNKYDVLALEELAHELIPWDNSINFSVYDDKAENVCKCGSKKFVRNGYFHTENGKYQRYRCVNCFAETRSKQNLLSKSKVKNLRIKTNT